MSNTFYTSFRAHDSRPLQDVLKKNFSHIRSIGDGLAQGEITQRIKMCDQKNFKYGYVLSSQDETYSQTSAPVLRLRYK